MTRIHVASSPGEVRIAVLGTSDALEDYAIWRPGRPDGVGDVYRARIIARVPSMAGAFVALPGADGFLPDSEGGANAVEGALCTVRIVRAGLGGKGPRLAAAPSGDGPPGLVASGPTPLDDLAARHPAAPLLLDDPALAAALRPRFAGRLRLVPTAFDDPVEAAIDALAGSDVALPGGLRASIHPTPALVAIDVDMAAATSARQPKAASQLAANSAALPALVQQIRLRNLSGAILLDPAGLSMKRRKLLGPPLRAALAADPLGARLLGFTALGLAEILRPRVRPPLHERLAGPHAAGLAALRAIAREAAATPHLVFALVCAPDVAAALGQEPVALPDLARRTGRPLILHPEPSLSPGSWRIERAS